MEQKLHSLKKFLNLKSDTTNLGDIEPQIGFKVAFCESDRKLIVKVIGARQLPTIYGNSKPYGYLVKVRVFPEKEKFETSVVKESWPTFNEEFIFFLNAPPKYSTEDYFKGKFVSLTVYAVLENFDEQSGFKSTNKLKQLFSFNNDYGDTSIRNKNSNKRASHRQSLNNRRTIGAATYNLDSKIFTQKLPTGTLCTPDIWRVVKEISSGIQTEPREGKKGSIELTLSYATSEDGKNDVVEVSVTKLRCSMQTMQEHEKLGGQLYIKITAFEYEDLIQKMKSDKFDPTISLKIEPNTATLRTTVNNYNIEQVKILIRLICKNIIGKKMILGKIEIDNKSDLWKQIVATPSVPITKMINFE